MGKKYSKEEIKISYDNTMEQINNAETIKDLPSLPLGNIVNYIASLLKKSIGKEADKEDAKIIANLYVAGREVLALETLRKIASKMTNDPYRDDYSSVICCFKDDYKLSCLVQEYIAKNNKILEIYKKEHDNIMKSISSASRISELPKGLSISKITSYLSNNSVVSKDIEKIPAEYFIKFANILLSGKTMASREVLDELLDITNSFYTDLKNPGISYVELTYSLLLKLQSLPRLQYYVDEVRYYMNTQKVFMGRSLSPVNIYYIPSKNSPVKGGNFYEICISRKDKVVDLKDIIPAEGVKDIAEYVRENADDTFKVAGGIILNKDETIGDIIVFKPYTGNVEITPAEKAAYEKFQELSTKLNALMTAYQSDVDNFKKQQADYEQRSSKALDLMGELSGEIESVLKTLKYTNKDNKNAN